jgi:hypothetical protein
VGLTHTEWELGLASHAAMGKLDLDFLLTSFLLRMSMIPCYHQGSACGSFDLFFGLGSLLAQILLKPREMHHDSKGCTLNESLAFTDV